MPFSAAALNVAANSIRSAATHASTHTATPDGTTGSNEGTATRQAITWGSATAGDFSLGANIVFNDGGDSEAVAAIGLWSASTAGTFYGYFPPTGDSAFNAAGEYTVTAIAVDGSTS
jgi:hypothetical protein